MDRFLRPIRTRTALQLDTDLPAHLDHDGYVTFCANDPENPKNWSKTRRWWITCAAVLLCLNATMASSAPSGALPSISETFHVGREPAQLTLTLFLVGYCTGPLLWAPLCELYGRRWVLYISFGLYVCFLFLCAFGRNFESLLIGRFIASVCVSGCLSVTPGILADIWDYFDRGGAMAVFIVTLFTGPAISPVIAGFFQLTEDFRWIFYMLLWLGGVSTLLMFTIPETLASTILANKARRLRNAGLEACKDARARVEIEDRSLLVTLRIAATRPWIMLFDPIAFFAALYLSVVYTLLYMLFTIYPLVFQEKRGWNPGVGELPLLGVIVGAAVGGLIYLYDISLAKKAQIKKGSLPPERRLYIAMFSGLLFPVAMFWFCWTGEYNSVPWIVPTIGGVFLSLVITLTFVGYLNYITDTYLAFASSANAANTIARSACAAAAPLYTGYMFEALGVGGGGSLIGGVACLLAPVPFIFYRYGKSIRRRSKFAFAGGDTDETPSGGDTPPVKTEDA